MGADQPGFQVGKDTKGPHVHSSDGNCGCYYEARKCIGGCGRVGKPDADGRYIRLRCERSDYNRREF